MSIPLAPPHPPARVKSGRRAESLPEGPGAARCRLTTRGHRRAQAVEHQVGICYAAYRNLKNIVRARIAWTNGQLRA